MKRAMLETGYKWINSYSRKSSAKYQKYAKELVLESKVEQVQRFLDQLKQQAIETFVDQFLGQNKLNLQEFVAESTKYMADNSIDRSDVETAIQKRKEERETSSETSESSRGLLTRRKTIAHPKGTAKVVRKDRLSE